MLKLIHRISFMGRILLASLALLIPTQAAVAKKEPFHVNAVEITLKKKKLKKGDEMAAALTKALTDEAAYYDRAGKEVTMKVEIVSLGFYSDSKAALSAIPLVGSFTGPNENKLKGKVQLVDQSGKVMKKFTIHANDMTLISDGKAAANLGVDILSGFLPIAGLVADTAMMAGEAALQEKISNEEILTRGFTRLAYAKMYNGKAYKTAQQRKKDEKAQLKAQAGQAAGAATAVDTATGAIADPSVPPPPAPIPAAAPAETDASSPQDAPVAVANEPATPAFG